MFGIYCLLFLLSPPYLQAEIVDTVTAKIVAENFYNSKITNSERKSSQQIRLNLEYQKYNTVNKLKSDLEIPVYYVFNVGKTNGFIIVAADDRVSPILGYSLESKYFIDNQPPGFVYWINKLEKQIVFAIENDISPESNIIDKWNQLKGVKKSYSGPVSPFYGPLLEEGGHEFSWGQDRPYNRMCPIYDTILFNPPEYWRSLAGCVAVAMGQIMRYWNYPLRGSGSHSYYEDDFGIQYANFEETKYDWANMPFRFNWDSVSYSIYDSAYYPIPELLYHCGVSVDMDYGKDSEEGSGADIDNVPESLINYFRYLDNIQIKKLSVFNYPNQWIEYLQNEIDAKRPVFYKAVDVYPIYDPTVHAFICDGYDSDKNFHFNWGWDGLFNGWYAISSLDPAQYDFETSEQIIIGIEPDIDGSIIDEYEIDDFYNQANWIYYNRPQIHSIVPISDVDWVKFTLNQDLDITLETYGGIGDTEIWLYNDDGSTLIAYDDDGGKDNFSKIIYNLNSGSYFVKVCAKGNNDLIASYKLSFSHPCPNPIDLIVDNVTATSARLNWAFNSDVGTYDIKYKPKLDSTWKQETISNNYYELDDLKCGTEYEWEVRTSCSEYTNKSDWVTGKGFTTLACTKPDLVIQNQIISPSYNVYQRTIVSQSFSIKNIGSSEAGFFNVVLYLSSDTNYDSTDLALSSASINKLFPGEQIPFLIESPLYMHPWQEPGDYYVLFIVDPTDKVAEDNENNNVSYYPITIRVSTPSSPDFIVTDLRIRSSTITCQSSVFEVAGIVKNNSSNAVGPSMLNIYLSEDELYDSDDILLRTSSVPSLSWHGWAAYSWGLFLGYHEPMETKTYYILFYVDPSNEIPEAYEENNISFFQIEVIDCTDLLPEANFTAVPTLVVCGDIVQFTDSTINEPIKWSWDFPGGTPTTSTLQNPEIKYDSIGTYDVKLTASNYYGRNSITKTNYIKVVDSYCYDTIFLTDPCGSFNDGSSIYNYQNNSNCKWLIQPKDASVITLRFNSLNIENGFDFINIYDGTGVDDPLLGSFTGSTIPTEITSSTGSMLVNFISDGSITKDGWEAYYIGKNCCCFNEMKTNLLPVYYGSNNWGDYDNDGDLDILLTGAINENEFATKIYRNDGDNLFFENSIGVSGIAASSSQFGDYDNDGDLDILLTGMTNQDECISRIYRNDGNGVFIDINANLPGVAYGSSGWGDYDNDGDLDVLLTGIRCSDEEIISKIYSNEETDNFKVIGTNLTGVALSSVAWGDYDNDGDLDILLTGVTNQHDASITKIYSNEGNGIFKDIEVDLPGVYYGSVAWGDYDCDGDLDILLAGAINNQGDCLSDVFYNNGNGKFYDANANLHGVLYSSAEWGDLDNDGDLDILLTGAIDKDGEGLSQIYINKENNNFTAIKTSLPNVYASSTSLGDYDHDSDLDILISGALNLIPDCISNIYKNDGISVNTKPSSPTELRTQIDSNCVLLSWSKSFDNETPQNGLSYNISIGTNINNCDVVSPMSNVNNGNRLINTLGNVYQNTSWTIKNLKPGKYYWSVQAIDNSYIGSEFAPRDSLIYPPISAFSLKNKLCIGEVIPIKYIGNASANAEYNWNFDGAKIIMGSGPGPYLVSWAESGIKNVTLFVSENYTISDTTIQQVLVNSLPKIFLGNDTTIFKTDSIILDGQSGFSEYLWNDGSTKQTLLIIGEYLDTASYTYSVVIKDSNNCISSDTIVITIESTTDISLYTNSPLTIKLYPNPTSDNVMVEFPNPNHSEYKLILTDVTGKVIQLMDNITEQSIELSLDGLSNGLYFIELKGSKTYKGKLIKE